MVFTLLSTSPLASSDTHADVTAKFNDARDIVGRSPRGGVGLLRLAIQKANAASDHSGKDLSTDIGNLVKEGLRKRIQ